MQILKSNHQIFSVIFFSTENKIILREQEEKLIQVTEGTKAETEIQTNRNEINEFVEKDLKKPILKALNDIQGFFAYSFFISPEFINSSVGTYKDFILNAISEIKTEFEHISLTQKNDSNHNPELGFATKINNALQKTTILPILIEGLKQTSLAPALIQKLEESYEKFLKIENEVVLKIRKLEEYTQFYLQENQQNGVAQIPSIEDFCQFCDKKKLLLRTRSLVNKLQNQEKNVGVIELSMHRQNTEQILNQLKSEKDSPGLNQILNLGQETLQQIDLIMPPQVNSTETHFERVA